MNSKHRQNNDQQRSNHKMTTNEKAQRVNNDAYKYGSFAEIGAGQETARWFFRAGKASGSIAKAMSAYDMVFSDAIYGAEKGHRYVCENRLTKMLDHEYGLLVERLGAVRDSSTQFFVYANTVASQKAMGGRAGHGWLGVRFIHKAGEEPSEAIIHVRLLNTTVLSQQEAVGSLGVNLLYGCFYNYDEPIKLLGSLNDNLNGGRVEVDMIRFSGPAFEKTDNRLMSLHLVELGLSNTALFGPDGVSLQPSDVLHKKHLLVQRGRFRPVTKLHIDMLEAGKKQFVKDQDIQEKDLLVLMEITMNNLLVQGSGLDVQDFLDRVDTLGKLGHHVLISNYGEYHRLSEFFSKYTREKVGIVMGVGHLNKIFDESYYSEMTGGVLEALGMLFRRGVEALIYPAHSLSTTRPASSDKSFTDFITSDSFEPLENVKYLFQHMKANKAISDISDFDRRMLRINSEDVINDIQKGGDTWIDSVPGAVAKEIISRGLFGYAEKIKKAG